VVVAAVVAAVAVVASAPSSPSRRTRRRSRSPACRAIRPVSTVYNLDGSESKNTDQGRGGPQEQVSKAMWDGAKLVVTTTINAGGNNIEQKRVFAMEGANPHHRDHAARTRRRSGNSAEDDLQEGLTADSRQYLRGSP
jgi:hypothetical protein